MVWCNEALGHSTLMVHIDPLVWGMGIWFLSEKKGHQCPLPCEEPTGTIFFFEALAICCTVHLTVGLMHPACLCIMTDNTNTFDVLRSLSVLPDSNPILMLAVNVLLKHKINLHVVYIPGAQNVIADALFQYNNKLTTAFTTFNPLEMHWGQPKND